MPHAYTGCFSIDWLWGWGCTYLIGSQKGGPLWKNTWTGVWLETEQVTVLVTLSSDLPAPITTQSPDFNTVWYEAKPRITQAFISIPIIE